jgi:FMN phosphatase YigB (HAD superfamily)
MRDSAVTFDFHNTIALSQAWFQIEVFDLPGAYLRWRAEQQDRPADQALIERANAAYRQLRKAIHQHGHELTAEQCLDLVLHQVGLDESPETIERGTEAIMRATMEGIAPVPGVIETIRALRDTGVRLGIVSSAVYHPFLLWTLDQFGIGDAFDSVTTSASAGFYKSRPEIYWSALELLDADPGQSLHLGDSFRFDVVGARRAGMRAAWLQRQGAEPLPDEPEPELTFQSLVGAAPILMERIAGHRSPRTSPRAF